MSDVIQIDFETISNKLKVHPLASDIAGFLVITDLINKGTETFVAGTESIYLSSHYIGNLIKAYPTIDEFRTVTSEIIEEHFSRASQPLRGYKYEEIVAILAEIIYGEEIHIAPLEIDLSIVGSKENLLREVPDEQQSELNNYVQQAIQLSDTGFVGAIDELNGIIGNEDLSRGLSFLIGLILLPLNAGISTIKVSSSVDSTDLLVRTYEITIPPAGDRTETLIKTITI